MYLQLLLTATQLHTVNKHLASILSQLVGKAPHDAKNDKIKLVKDNIVGSYTVTSIYLHTIYLFTCNLEDSNMKVKAREEVVKEQARTTILKQSRRLKTQPFIQLH